MIYVICLKETFFFSFDGLDAKCNVNAVNNDGVTALHEAVVRNDAKLVEELLVRGADPNIEATSG